MTSEEIELIHAVDIHTRYASLPKCDEFAYRELHSKPLVPTSIKINVELFKSTMQQYSKYFKPWSKNRPEMFKIRKGLPLVNLTGQYTDAEDPTIGPLDYHNKINPDKPLLETDIVTPTKILYEECFKPLEILHPYLVRSSILKWEKGANFVPHVDTGVPTPHLRLWGTDNPESIKVRFKNNLDEYVEVTNVEAGRIYIIDTAEYHDALCTSTMGYQFFIAVNVAAYDLLNNIKETQ
jgi:hypothetical protein